MEYSLGVKEINDDIPIQKPEDVIHLLADYRDIDREVMLVVHLDSNLDARGIQTAAIGNKTTCCFDTCDIFREAIVRRSDAIIMVHNHPQEKAVEVTRDDIICTREIFQTSKAAKIPLLDHVIIGKRNWISLRREGITIPKGDLYILEMESNWLRSGRNKRAKNMLRMINRAGGGFILRP